jgi:hypothetical protein
VRGDRETLGHALRAIAFHDTEELGMSLPSISKEAALEDLRDLIDVHQLTHADVAELACVSRKTVESWLASPASANHRTMPSRHIRTIRFALPSFLRARK